MSKARNYSCTLNNWTQEEYDCIYDLDTVYTTIGKEVGAQSSLPHLHFQLCFKNPVSFEALKKKIPRARIEVTKKVEDYIRYSQKNGDYIEKGERPKGQGKRTDIDEVRDLVKTTGSMRQVVEKCKSYQTVRMAEVMMKYYEPVRSWKPKVKWYFGETGSGKSYQARIDFSGQDYYTSMADGKWFEGYDAHENVIIDDIRVDFMKYKTLLQFLDRYEFRVETKGGSRQFLARNIIITCPMHPQELYRDIDEDNRQLLRRIDEVWWFKRNEPAIRDCIHLKLLQSFYSPSEAREER